MKILIIGGTKFIGKAVARQAAARGHDVTLFNRGKTAPDTNFKVICGDVDDIKSYRDELRNANFDVVIHAIAYNERHSLDVIEVFSHTNARIIALGSQDCYEAFYQLNHGRDSAEMPIAEDSETCHKRLYWQDRPGSKVYEDYDKNLMTDALLKAHMEGKVAACVLRLGMVFGPGDHQFRYRHGKMIRRIYDREPLMTFGAIEQTQLFSFGYIENVAAAIVHTAESPTTNGRVFNISERKTRSFRRWAELYADAAGVPFEFSILPDALLQKDLADINNPPRLLLMDTRAFAEATGFIEPISLAEQIEQTLAWGLQHPEVLGPKPDYELERRQAKSFATFLSQAIT